MEGSIILPLILQVVLIALNAVFACAEIAVISMNDTKLAKMVEEGNKKAVRLARLTSQPARFLATIQVAITLSGFMGSAFAADNFSDVLVQWLVNIGVKIPEKTLDTIAVVVITLILSYFTLVFGELVPKRLAMKKAETLALGMSGMITFISKLFAPIVWMLTASTNLILRLLRIDPNANDNDVSEEEIRMMVDQGSKQGVIDLQEKEMIQNIFEFDDLTVDEFATHRTEISLLWMDENEEQWEKTIHETRHSVYPVCDETVDRVVGILNVKDYFRLKDKSRASVMKNAVRPAVFVPETLKADVLFREMQKSRNHFAVVLDEYGGMVGIVTMNDLLEQLVGDLENEEYAPVQEPEIEKIDSSTWKIQGSASLGDVEAALKVALPRGEYDTFGGLVFACYGTIPDDAATFEIDIDPLHVKVEEIRKHRIRKALVCVNGGNEDLPGSAREEKTGS